MMVALSTIGFGLAPLFTKAMSNAGFASPVVPFYRYLFVAILLLPALTFTPEKRATSFLAMSTGFAMAFGWITYVEGLKSIPVATMGVIYMTYPLFTLLIGMLWLRQVPSRRAILAALLILMAALIALSPASVESDMIKPLLLSFLAPLTFGYAVVTITDKLITLTPVERLAGMSFGATLGLLPLILSLDPSVVIPSQLNDWLLVFSFAIVTAFLPQFLYIVGAPFIGSAQTAIVGSFELPVMFVVGWLAFGEQITLLQYVAGVLVVSAIWMTSDKSSDDVSKEVEVDDLSPNSKTTTSNKAV